MKEQEIQEASRNFYSIWNSFKQRHPGYANWDYILSSDLKVGRNVVILYQRDKVTSTTVNAGYVWDIGNWPFASAENHILNLISTVSPSERGIIVDQDKLNEKATKDGELFAEIALYISSKMADLPMRLAYPLTSRLAKALGYIDTDSNDAF